VGVLGSQEFVKRMFNGSPRLDPSDRIAALPKGRLRLNSAHVIELMGDCMLQHGVPEHVRSDNGQASRRMFERRDILLAEGSPRRHRAWRPRETPGAIQKRVLALRQAHGWGALKLQVLLAREGVRFSAVTIHRILKRNGAIVDQSWLRSPETHFHWTFGKMTACGHDDHTSSNSLLFSARAAYD
jgi:hypothetical protein